MARRPSLLLTLVVTQLAIYLASPPAAFSGAPVREEALKWDQDLFVIPNLSNNPKPLIYALPAFLSNERSSLLTVEVLEDGRPVVRQTIELPAGRSEASVIEVLADHPDRLRHLRKLEAALPRRIRLGMWLGDQLLEEISLHDLEEEMRSRTPLAEPAIGITRQVEFLAGGALSPSTAKSYEQGRDPVCVQECDNQRQSCYIDRCDPRGSCDFCEDYYDSCVLSCPLAPNCPTTREYSTTTVTGQFFYNCLDCVDCFLGFGAFDGRIHQLSHRTLRTQTWREIRHCDGSTTQTLLSTFNHAENCWQQFNNDCSPWTFNNTIYPTCFPY